MTRQYGAMALTYDRWMADIDYDQWWSYVESAFDLVQVPPRHILEVGCGTGSLTLQMLRRGYQVTASDYSESMLAQAENKLRDFRSLRLLRLDMRALPEELGRFDTIVAACDVVNYLCSIEDLASFFKSAHALLAPGGQLLFDVHGPARVQEWQHCPFMNRVGEKTCYLWRVDLKETSIWHYLTGFTQDNDGSWKRFDELHRQRYHTSDEITAALTNAGFTSIVSYDFGSKNPAGNNSLRIQFGAQA